MIVRYTSIIPECIRLDSLFFFYCTVVTIGFDPDQYTVSEPDGTVTLMVRLINGVLERDITVDFETSPGTATSAGNLNKRKSSLDFTECVL